MSTPSVALAEGVQIPQLGFGVFQVAPDSTAAVVREALEAGYRHIDTAAAYRNEAGVGQAVREAAIAREQVFITTKCWNSQQGYEQAKRALARSLQRLCTDYVDLYLIHWPAPAQDLYLDTWRAFIELHREGLARAIGVSNFNPEHLARVIEQTGVAPAVNQVELHPRFQQQALRAEHERLGIATEAWSPLGQGDALDEQAIVQIAAAHSRTPAQVVIRWHLQLGNVVIPKSATPERIRANFDVFGFELNERQMAQIAALESGRRMGPDPATFLSP